MNYVEIAAKIVDTVENEDPEFLLRVPEFINTTQDQLMRRLDNFWLNTVVVTTITAGTFEVSLPTVNVIQHFRVVASTGSSFNLVPQNEAWLREYWPEETSVGLPKYYARMDNTSFLVAPATAEDLVLHVKGSFAPAALSSSAPTNIMTDKADLALFYGAMVEANRYLKNWKTVDLWNSAFENEINLFINDSRRGRRDDTRGVQGVPSPNNVVPGVP